MKCRAVGVAALTLAACSDLGSSDDTVIALEVTSPPGAVVEAGDTVQYTAVALNRNGDPIPAPIRWATPDTAIIAVDSLSGVVLGRKPGQGRVQATSDSLVSPLNILTVIVSADTLILVPPDSIVVDTLTTTISSPLVARLESFNPPAPVEGRPIYYEVIEPVFATPADATVELANGALADTAITGTNGEPVTPMTLGRIPGVTPPDSAIVEIRSTRYKDTQPVPGSGQRWVVHFGI
jgi:hypothetical protein